ncbi:hypothetical protein PG997_002728 [Apiospora hydei]|uniref:Uncharacterized protein n=1 Tax=Apiospora hydei TaxID=1337664 RepID=A0ABR1WXE5_9PEZI
MEHRSEARELPLLDQRGAEWCEFVPLLIIAGRMSLPEELEGSAAGIYYAVSDQERVRWVVRSREARDGEEDYG